MFHQSMKAVREEFQRLGYVMIEGLPETLLADAKREVLVFVADSDGGDGLDKKSDFLFDLARSSMMQGLAETLLNKPVVALRVDFQRLGSGCRHWRQDQVEYFPHFDLEPAISLYLFLDEQSGFEGSSFEFISNPECILGQQLPCDLCNCRVAKPASADVRSLTVPALSIVACHSLSLYRISLALVTYRSALVFRYRGSPYREHLLECQE